MVKTNDNIELIWHSPSEKLPETDNTIVYIVLNGERKQVDKESWGEMEPFLVEYDNRGFYEKLDDGSDDACYYPLKDVAAWAEVPRCLPPNIMNMNKALEYSLCKLNEE